MAGNKELETELKAMAEDFRLPGGERMKLSQLVAGHLVWFDTAERRGLRWQDMIRLLTAAGVTGRGGKPLGVGTLSSTVWRKRAEEGRGIDPPSRAARPAPPLPIEPRSKSPQQAKHSPAGQPSRGKRSASPQINGDAQAGRTVLKPAAPSSRGARAQTNKEVLAFMQRAVPVARASASPAATLAGRHLRSARCARSTCKLSLCKRC